MATSSIHKAGAKRSLPRWVAALLAILLLVGWGSELHGQACDCAENPSEICYLCESHPQDSALAPTVSAVCPPCAEESAYHPPRRERPVLTDLEKDHPPPKQALAG